MVGLAEAVGAIPHGTHDWADFTTPEERRRTGAWWKREYRGMYLPPVSLDSPDFRNLLQRLAGETR